LSPQYIIPANTNPKSSLIQEIHVQSGREFQVQGHFNSTMQHTFVPCKYKSEICIHSEDTERKGISGSKVTGSRSKVTAPCDKPMSPNISSLYTNPKSSFVLEIQSRIKGNIRAADMAQKT
jgi:hypothetical protein